jgi:hypothetical protein
MRFLISVIDNESGTGTSQEMAAIDSFNETLQSNGHWVIAVGIAAPKEAFTIDNRENLGSLTSGSDLYGAEFQSGFWIVEVADEQTAKELAMAGSKACNRKVELRPLLGN